MPAKERKLGLYLVSQILREPVVASSREHALELAYSDVRFGDCGQEPELEIRDLSSFECANCIPWGDYDPARPDLTCSEIEKEIKRDG